MGTKVKAASFMDIEASADFVGNGAIETNRYETEIADIVRRNSVFLGRVDRVPATGHPHRYFEQTAIGSASFTDPHNIAPTASGPTRLERPVMIKAITNQTNMSLFDIDVTRQQGQFAYVEAKDIDDVVNSVVVCSAGAVWAGNDTSLVAPTTTQYVGLLTQITNQATVLPGASIIDAIKSKVASMVGNASYVIKPTAIYVNPVLGDYIDREAKAAQVTFGSVDVAAGVTVKTISTQAGDLPLITDAFLGATAATVSAYGFSAVPAGYNGYYAVILMEKEVEMPVVHGGDGNLKPRLFQLGLLSGLQGQYVAVQFDAIVAKMAGYAHAVVQVIRP